MGTALAAAIAGFAAQRQVRAEHRHWRRQMRRDAYAALAARADEVREALRGIEAEFGTPAHDLQELRTVLTETRRTIRDELGDALRSVELEGPPELARMAGELVKSLSACAAVIQARTGGRTTNQALGADQLARIRGFLNHADGKRERFMASASRAIDVR
ncbi:hypothetical protein AB0D49_24520 [Streptomyces sp. NPDC048290]|uniref:hypothetical protein n=1 Tax=Streptomyces sp. NPDC048290 TaxID=3155811 RepID=UPI0034485179